MLVKYNTHKEKLVLILYPKKKNIETALEYGARVHHLYFAGKMHTTSYVTYKSVELKAGNKSVFTTLN